MTKTLAAVLVIVVAAGMAWGIYQVAKRNEAVSTFGDEQREQTQQTDNFNYDDEVLAEIDLEITAPEDGEIVSKSSVELSGQTEAMAEVFVDDKVLKVDKDGKFSIRLTLDEGENEIVVTANDENGFFVEKAIKVTYEPAN